jgi:HTH-type transcriptional regulator, sugar sensing transcriptional regulator
LIPRLSENMYEKQLTKAGLTRKQAKVYMACLELGQAKVPDIAKRAEVKRTTAYGILDELTEKGLVSFIKKGKSKIFKAQDPKAVISMIQAQKEAIDSVLPELESIYATYQLRPHMQFFEGRNGIKRIYEDTLTSKEKKVLQIVNVKDFKNFPGGDFSREYIKKRVSKNIIAYALHPKSGDVYDSTYGQPSIELKRQVRYLPPSMFYASMIMIYDHKVAMISTKQENFGFIIESKEFSNTMRAYFDFMWNVGSSKSEE